MILIIFTFVFKSEIPQADDEGICEDITRLEEQYLEQVLSNAEANLDPFSNIFYLLFRFLYTEYLYVAFQVYVNIEIRFGARHFRFTNFIQNLMKLIFILHNSSYYFIFMYIIDFEEERLARRIVEICLSNKRISRKVIALPFVPWLFSYLTFCGSLFWMEIWNFVLQGFWTSCTRQTRCDGLWEIHGNLLNIRCHFFVHNLV